MAQLTLFPTRHLRDRRLRRNYSAQADEFRREHERHRAWGLARRHARRLRQLTETETVVGTGTGTGVGTVAGAGAETGAESAGPQLGDLLPLIPSAAVDQHDLEPARPDEQADGSGQGGSGQESARCGDATQVGATQVGATQGGVTRDGAIGDGAIRDGVTGDRRPGPNTIERSRPAPCVAREWANSIRSHRESVGERSPPERLL
jgi:hypothetical protein